MNSRQYDVVVLGASGFTGRLVVEYLLDTYGVDGELKWAIAGRNRAKLEEVRALFLDEQQQSTLPILIADSTDERSLADLAQSTRVICTTVGPYALYGTPVVAACVAAGTHYCDLTGEVHWMAQLIPRHQGEAQKSGARIVHCCGFDSIPFDLGVWFLQDAMLKKYGHAARAVKTGVARLSGGASGGTIASILNMLKEADNNPDITALMKEPYSLNPPEARFGPDGEDQTGAVFDPSFKQWTSPFVMAVVNTRVVRRSNALLDFLWGKDFSYAEATLCKSKVSAVSKSLAGSLGMATLAFGPGRRLAARLLPKPGQGPSKKAREAGFYELLFHASHPDNKDLDMRARVSGNMDPGYGSTSKMLAEAAVCLAKDDLHVDGGFWTPASAMNTALIERLEKSAGMTFEIVATA